MPSFFKKTALSIQKYVQSFIPKETTKPKRINASKSRFLNSSAHASVIGHSLHNFKGFHGQNYEEYYSNVIVYRCVTLLARSVASVPLILYKSNASKGAKVKKSGRKNMLTPHDYSNHEHEIDQHPVLDLLNNPREQMNSFKFIEHCISHWLLSGNCFIEIKINEQGLPCHVQLHKPEHVEVNDEGYWITENHPRKRRWISKDTTFAPSLMIHLSFFNPFDKNRGLSPLHAAAASIDQHNAVGQHNLSLLQQGGRPSGALLYCPKGDHFPLTETQREDIKNNLKDIYSGSQNAGKIMLLEGDFEWKEMGITPKDLDFVEGKNVSAREICQAFGVPPMLAGVPGDATFANYKEARFHLWEDTILSLLDTFVNHLNSGLLPFYGNNLRLGYDLDAIQALAPKRESAWSKIANVDFLTMDEKRQAIGYGPLSTTTSLNDSCHMR